MENKRFGKNRAAKLDAKDSMGGMKQTQYRSVSAQYQHIKDNQQERTNKKGRKHNAYGPLVRNQEYIVVEKTLNAQAIIGGGRI